jgi:hypothetical protein
MALKTLGTAGTTTLSAVKFNQSPDVLNDADIAALNVLVKPDSGTELLRPFFSRAGQLWIPQRGWVKVLAGDYIAVDPTTGWPILLSGAAAAGASYVHT